MKLRNIITDILKVLEKVQEKEWIPVFRSFLEEVDSMDRTILNKRIKKIYGGMGSFNDLVLYKNEQLCFKENVLLDNLRKELFDKIK